MENDLYFNGFNVLKDGLSYCVDMIRLTCYIPYSVFNMKINSRLSFYDDFLTSWISSRITDFYYNFNYCNDDCSFWFGFISNKEKVSGKSLNNANTVFNFTIEFNPNKVKDCPFLVHILSITSDWFIKQCDFAVDVNTNICNICGFDKGKKNCLVTYDCGKDNKTYYIGKKDNRVKIYNKSFESNLNYDLTRIEITKYFDCLKLCDVSSYCYDGYVPELFLKDFQLSFNDLKDKTLFALVYAVLEGFPLHDLTKHYRKKVKEFLQKKKPINIDFNCFTVTLVKYLGFYFPFITSV